MNRELLKNVALSIAVVILGTLVAEAVMRWSMPWLAPGGAGYSRESGLPVGWLEGELTALRERPPELIFVGDSFVLSGLQPAGFISNLVRLTNRPIAGLGVNGASPSQYWFMCDAVRRAGLKAPIVVLLYIGNDLADESVWTSVAPDRTQYESARIEYYSDPAQPTYWPCFQIRPELSRPLARADYALRRHSALYRASLLALGRSSQEDNLARYMTAQCDRAPWAERVGDRLFFFRLHDAMVNPGSAPLAAARASILDALRQRKDLAIAPVLDREEACAGVHGRAVLAVAPFIEGLRAQGQKVLDTNPDLVRECMEHQLFLPDGHWTAEGHRVFARSLLPLLVTDGLLPNPVPVGTGR